MSGRITLGVANPSLGDDGAPIAGSTWTFYQNGTTTLVSIYSNAALTVALANPLTCDAAGLFPQVFADDTAAYTVKWSRPGYADITYDDIHTDNFTSAPNIQVKTSGTNQTYTTPTGAKALLIRMVAAGGGGAGTTNGSAVAGSDGGVTSWGGGAVSVNGGKGGTTQNGGAGGTAGIGSGNLVFRINGGGGGCGLAFGAAVGGGINPPSGIGGASYFGGGGKSLSSTSGSAAGDAGGAYGSGGGGALNSSGNGTSGSGGGAGEYAELLITSPAASYVYTIGVGGAGGVSTQSGGAGATGAIIIEARF